MNFIIKSIGVAGDEIEEFWIQELPDLERIAFPKHRHPSIENGDRLVLYATGHQRLIAAGEITSDPEFNPGILVKEHEWPRAAAKRWPWVVSWEPQIVVPFVRLGPTLTDIGVSTYSIRSQSHIFIEESIYRRTVGLLASAAASDGELYVPAYRDSVVGITDPGD